MTTTRRLIDTAALLVMMLATLWGFGILGSPVNQTNSGALSADATLLAPYTTAFSIWSLIYLLLVAYVVWIWTPTAGRSQRAANLGWLPAASMVLNGAWLAITQAGGLWLSVVDIAALALVLGLLMRRLTMQRPAGDLEALLLNGTFGLYLGWVTVATCANVTAAAVASGVDLGRIGNTVAAVVVLVVATALGVTFSRVYRGASWVAGAMIWGLGWIARGRLAANPTNTVVGVAAALSALVILAAFLLPWWRAESARGSKDVGGAVTAK